MVNVLKYLGRFPVQSFNSLAQKCNSGRKVVLEAEKPPGRQLENADTDLRLDALKYRVRYFIGQACHLFAPRKKVQKRSAYNSPAPLDAPLLGIFLDI